ncbi:MAG TPA: type I-U CRISPR-associated protein Csx17, partial [Fimbriimonadaceae bacterium]|nr:type I-U CRISPR-associated protein Csx17 [Fimbriimonadaceae bacterium]
MSLPDGVPLPGCRHDVLGHALKAIGVLRALATCAAADDCDAAAEGSWDSATATFKIRSARYPDADSLAKFFAEKYRPTPIFAPWHKTGGITDNLDVAIASTAGDIEQFRKENETFLEGLGLKTTKKLAPSGALVFTLKSDADLSSLERTATSAGLSCQHKQKKKGGGQVTEVTITTDRSPLEEFFRGHRDRLVEFGLTERKEISAEGVLKFASDSSNRDAILQLVAAFNGTSHPAGSPPVPTDVAEPQRDRLRCTISQKESGKTDGAVPRAAALLRDDPVFQECLCLARSAVSDLQGEDEEVKSDAFLRYRDLLPDRVAESVDSLCTLFLTRENDNPLLLRRGRPGDKVRGHIFASYWEYFEYFRAHSLGFARASLFAERVTATGVSKKHQVGKGTPFFPDAIKSYNQGADWVTEEYPFCPLDYLLAVEGALAMRGATSKTLNARSRTRAAFPFVFEATETMTDEQGKALKLASSFWFPIWTRPTGYDELQSFVLDSQARLATKECRFSSDFGRAIRSQGVDAGFAAFQEFRFKLKGANVPWTTAGRFVPCTGTPASGMLNELLAPVDESGFLNQFEFHTSRETRADLHPLRAPVLDAIEAAAAEPDESKVLDVLCRLADLNAQLAKSKSLREKVGSGRVIFVPPLRCENWSEALTDLEGDREFEIARALASIQGRERQSEGSYSQAEPFLGSLLPLQRGQRCWFLPDPPSPQAVWSGIDLTRDLSAILARRVIDSEADFRPALVGACSARLSSLLAFLGGELDDARIARLVEGLSLVDWQQPSERQLRDAAQDTGEQHLDAVPVAYAAVRSLVEIACDASSSDSTATSNAGPRATVQRTVSLVTRQEPGMVVAGVTEALRRLAIVGVPNIYGEAARQQKPKLAGQDVVAFEAGPARIQCDPALSRRLAAAVLIGRNRPSARRRGRRRPHQQPVGDADRGDPFLVRCAPFETLPTGCRS